MGQAVSVKTIKWKGKSGNAYKYGIYQISENFEATPGNYCFAKETKPNTWKPLYFGETEDLSERFDNHHKIDCAKREGATHIHAHVSGGKQARLNEEADLVENYKPVCNG